MVWSIGGITHNCGVINPPSGYMLDEELRVLITPQLRVIPPIDHTIRYTILEYPTALTDLGFSNADIYLLR